MSKGTKFQISGPEYDNVSQFLHYMIENLRLEVDYMERWLH